MNLIVTFDRLFRTSVKYSTLLGLKAREVRCFKARTLTFVIITLATFFCVNVRANPEDEKAQNIVINNSQRIDVNIAVASNFYHALQQLLQEFSNVTQYRYLGHEQPNICSSNNRYRCEFKVSTGSTGALFSQIVHGAPFALFLAADQARPNKLEQMQLSAFRQTYAIGKLALWSPKLKMSNMSQLQQLQGKLTIANPRLAPFGQAAIESLQVVGLYQQLSSQLLRANNVNQAFQFVDTGNANLAFLAESQLLNAYQKFNDQKYQNYLLVPTQYYQPIKQQLVVLKAKHREKNRLEQIAALTLAKFILSEHGQQSLSAMGYQAITTNTPNEGN